MTQKINKIGIELEGGFDSTSRLNHSLGSYHDDGSVNVDREYEGEFVSIPLNVDQIDDFVLNNYPDETNRTCGGHVHISLKSASDYMELMSQEFMDFYLAQMTIWGNELNINSGSAFWKRLRGEEHYCLKRFEPIRQRDSNHESIRYSQLNYCYHEQNRHTLEFRMLPCFQKKELMALGVKKTCEIVENYLENHESNKVVSMRIEL